MGRPSEGWKLRPPRGKSPHYTVRFRWAGQDFEPSTGTSDPGRAAEEAARIYAHAIATVRPVQKRQQPQKRISELEGAITEWLEALEATLDPGTVGSYADYGNSHWIPFFAELHNITDATTEEYRNARLKKVSASTTRKELSALRGFIRWASEPKRNYLPAVHVPSVPKKTVGTVYEKRRRAKAIPISPTEARRIIRELPEWSTSRRVARFPIRARFLVAYETGLRPELLDQLSVPEHYEPGATELNITAELDKGRWVRRVPLSKNARQALRAVCPEAGVIFGAHDYREHLRSAAAKALSPDRAKVFTGAHLRSARATHWLDRGAPITAVQFLLGHLRMETTARYIRASERAARKVVR